MNAVHFIFLKSGIFRPTISALIRCGIWSLLLSGAHSVCAQDIQHEYRFNLLFRKNHYELDADFRDNTREMAGMYRLLSDSVFRTTVDSIRISAYASPEGLAKRNGELALNRAWAARRYLRQTYPMLNPDLIHARKIVSEDWEGLYHSILHDTLIARRNTLASGLRAQQNPEMRKAIFYNTDSTPDCGYIEQYVQPVLRRAEIALYTNGASPIRLCPKTENLLPDTLQLPPCKPGDLPSIPAPSVSKPDSTSPAIQPQPRFALKTNLLYWAATLLNIEAELYVGRRWSVNVDYQYAWWSNRSEHHYFRIAAVSPEVRYWFASKKRFKGHFAGAYVGGGLYEFMFKPSYGLQGEFFIAGGVTYGYMFPLGRRLRMELSLGVGYMMTEYREYYWDRGCYVYEKTKRYSYLGPTKAKVSLVLPLSRFKRRNGNPRQ